MSQNWGSSIAPKSNAPTPLRILVVDDNIDAADSMAMMLRKFGGHTVDVAYGGLQAVQIAELTPPDVVLLDIGLPSISGFEVAERLRQLPIGDRLVIIAVTGYCQPDDRKQSQVSGIDLHLAKPVDLAQLLDYLNGTRVS